MKKNKNNNFLDKSIKTLLIKTLNLKKEVYKQKKELKLKLKLKKV